MKKKILTFLLILIIVFFAAGCSEPENDAQSSLSSDKISFTDSLGNTVEVTPDTPTAVLSGSLAEAWQLAGGTFNALTDDAFSSETLIINEDTVNVGSLKGPDMEILLNANVDYVIMSPDVPSQLELKDTLENAGITTAYFSVETFDDYKSMMKIFTDITGRKDLYEKNVENIEEEIDEQLKRADGSTPTVLFLRAYSTGIKAKGSDSMTGEMLKQFGCINIADDGSLLEEMSIEAIIMADPDYIFITTMGDSQEAALAMADEMLISNPAWSTLSAVKKGHYVVLPKELFQNKPNERWAESYKILADILFPEN